MSSQKIAIIMKWTEGEEQDQSALRILESAHKEGFQTSYLHLPEEARNMSLPDLIQHFQTSMEYRETLPPERRIETLGEDELKQLEQVREILDKNLFSYVFQPIVSAMDGEIFAYEALMRAPEGAGIGPLDILKYAGMMNRFGDVEKATFLNVTRTIDENKTRFGKRLVFINSIPGARVLPEDYLEIDNALWSHADNLVVEMTEQTEASEQKIRALKRRFDQMGIPLALDDYGTGYSNVVNLLEYMPKYVKIDRSLIAEIHDNPKKKRFVREIIDFCHDNDIMALAEGVETWKELRAVVRMGVDLIQGFYTSKPNAEILDGIPGDLKQEISRYQNERQAGIKEKIFLPDETGRVQLSFVEKSSYNCILVGKAGSGCGDVTIAGIHGKRTHTHMVIGAGYQGTITLDNASFYGQVCIDVGENADVTFVLKGANFLEKGGIRVPETATVIFEGGGSLDIHLDSAECFGIGNSQQLRYGTMIFRQDGAITVEARGLSGICIGGGWGNAIHIERGKYNLSMNCDRGVAIGSLFGDNEIILSTCEADINLAVTRGVGVGSVSGSARMLIHSAAVRSVVEATDAVAYGTMDGGRTDMHVHDASVDCQMRGETIIAIGSKAGATEYRQERSTLRVTLNGHRALAFGGFVQDTNIYMEDCDTSVEVNSATETDSLAPESHFHIRHGRNQFMVNGAPVEHVVDYEQ
jgi:EAL domain-containing protein (putative c-di-GMP-specific phosphodiesterase class I)